MSSEASPKVSMALLRTLHRIQRQRSDIKSQLQRGPRQIQASEGMIEHLSGAASEAADKLRKAKMAADEKQLQLKSREDRLRDLQTKLNNAASNKEYTMLKEQIAADQQANEVLSDEIFEALERLDVLEAERKQREQEVAERRQEHQRLAATTQEKLGGLETELQRIEAELAEAEQELPAEFRRDYDRLVASRGEEALAPVDGENCGGCHQTLTSQMMNRLYLAQPVRCPACGAMMYLAEDRTVR